jgi:beta-glucosidase/6-phospho-beta-glucosidase/beta-galactosidase
MAHNEAYKLIHQIQIESNVTLSPNFRNYFPARNHNFFDHLILPLFNAFYNHLFPFSHQKNIFSIFNLFKKNQLLFDFMLVSFYGDQEIKASFSKPFQTLDLQTSKGIKILMNWALSFKKPVYILSSNPNPNDITYLLSCLHTIWKIANINPFMNGFFYHSLVDGFEWDKYFDLPTGLLNKNTSLSHNSKRITTDVYKNILQNNSISYELVKAANPHLVNELFP